MSDRIGKGENQGIDKNGSELSVPDTGLKWKEYFIVDPDYQGDYKYSK